jgi:hypothetical protein
MLVVASLAVTLAMALAVGSGSANRLSISHGSLLRAIWSNFVVAASGIRLADCHLTLEGSFHSATISKVSGALVGFITRGSINTGACLTNDATLLAETLPWHITYSGFNGTLPAPEPKFAISGFSVRVTAPLFGPCLTRTERSHPALLIAQPNYEGGRNGLVNGLTFENGAMIDCVSLGSTTFGGSAASVTEQPGGSANILIRLI